MLGCVGYQWETTHLWGPQSKHAAPMHCMPHPLSTACPPPPASPALQGPFSAVVDRHVSDPWLRSLLDLECFVLSGMLARDTLTAEMAFMFMERSRGRGRIDYPVSPWGGGGGGGRGMQLPVSGKGCRSLGPQPAYSMSLGAIPAAPCDPCDTAGCRQPLLCP
jgi:hypothetical protein